MKERLCAATYWYARRNHDGTNANNHGAAIRRRAGRNRRNPGGIEVVGSTGIHRAKQRTAFLAVVPRLRRNNGQSRQADSLPEGQGLTSRGIERALPELQAWELRTGKQMRAEDLNTRDAMAAGDNVATNGADASGPSG